MADYQKMYAVLCSAVDEVIDPLERIPLALSSARILRAALARAGLQKAFQSQHCSKVLLLHLS